MTNPLIDEFNQAPWWQKLLIILLTLIIVLFSLKNILFYNSSQKLHNLHRSLSEQQATIANYNSLLSTSKLPQKTASTSPQRKVLTKSEYTLALSQLSGSGFKSLNILDIKPGVENRQEPYASEELTIYAQGSLEGIINFSRNIGQRLPGCGINSLVMEKRDSGSYSAEFSLITAVKN